jgi:hypothetical protein
MDVKANKFETISIHTMLQDSLRLFIDDPHPGEVYNMGEVEVTPARFLRRSTSLKPSSTTQHAAHD